MDIVYTWVDATADHIKNELIKLGKDVNTSRMKNNNELLFSLRSLEKFMPWHKGRIFIVTNDQIPTWLNVNHPRIKMIYHRDIIPKKYLPTFNSYVIEAHLFKIPTLTETFIYFNDDFLLNNFIDHDDIINQDWEIPIYTNKNRINVKESNKIWVSGIYNTANLLNKFNYDLYFLHHSPFIFYKSNLKYIYNVLQHEFKKSLHNKFRSKNDISICHGNYIHSLNFELGTIVDNDSSSHFFIAKDDVTENDLNKIFNLKTKYLCINDEYKKASTQKLIEKILLRNYPKKSQFEL